MRRFCVALMVLMNVRELMQKLYLHVGDLANNPKATFWSSSTTQIMLINILSKITSFSFPHYVT